MLDSEDHGQLLEDMLASMWWVDFGITQVRDGEWQVPLTFLLSVGTAGGSGGTQAVSTDGVPRDLRLEQSPATRFPQPTEG